jgi:uncharacterized protein YbbK (DUF523 family)
MVTQPPVLVSACLAGLRTRYDGRIVEDRDCIERLKGCIWIPVCPEQFGGLPTPRCPADITGGSGEDVLDGTAQVIDSEGVDISEPFIRGAEMVLEIARQQRVEEVLLKARSPSCGVQRLGVTAALLKRNGFKITEFG